jgi:hypothetical protein
MPPSSGEKDFECRSSRRHRESALGHATDSLRGACGCVRIEKQMRRENCYSLLIGGEVLSEQDKLRKAFFSLWSNLPPIDSPGNSR